MQLPFVGELLKIGEQARLDWEKLSTEDLVAELLDTGLQPPLKLIGEILRRGRAAVPILGSIVTDEDLWESDDEDRWAPVFALHFLGSIGDPSAIEYVLGALRLDPDPDEIVENTPTIIGHLGPTTVPALTGFIMDEKVEGLMRGVACDGLASIALLHPDKLEEVIAFLRRFVEEASQHDPVAVTGAILSLVELRDKEALPVIERAFNAKRVDQDFLSLADVRELMGRSETISKDWHYTGDPLQFFNDERQAKLREREARHQ